MKVKRSAKRFAELGIAVTAIASVVAGCGGGGGSGSGATGASTTIMSGIVADGYLTGAKVCLDKNSNSICDAGEPVGTTTAGGAYSIAGVTAADIAAYSVIAEIPPTAVDADTGLPVGQAFTLAAPAGASFVSPLTTLVQDKVATGATAASAVAAVGQALGIPAASGVSALDNYVALKGAATDQTNGYFRAHEAAKTVAVVLKVGKGVLGSTSASTDQGTQRALLAEAEGVLQAQAASNVGAAGAMFVPGAVNASSVAGVGTLKSAIAANNVSVAAATQPVTINFDVVNGATVIGTTGCSSTTLTLGSLATPGQIKDLRFYVSNIALIDAAGNYTPVVLDVNANQDRSVALLDFEDGTGSCGPSVNMMGMTVPGGTTATYTAVTGKVAPGNYVGVALTVGVPENLNHTDPAATATTPAPLRVSAMNWSWQSGRKFTKIEFKSSAATPATTMTHLGSLNCKANPAVGDVLNGCGSPNRMRMSFASFNPSTQKIALDLGSLWGGLDLTTSQTWMSGKVAGMMTSSPAYYYDKFQIDLATGLPINDGAAQTLFVVR